MPNSNPVRTAVFVPCFRLHDRIESVLRELAADECRSVDLFIVVDNASDDGTPGRIERVLRELKDPRFVFLRNRRNYLLGGSCIIALDHAIAVGAEYFVCYHGDGQAPASEIQKLMDALVMGNDVALGGRWVKGADHRDYSRLRLIGNRVFARLQAIFLSVPDADFGGIFAIRLSRLAEVPYRRIPPDMAYTPFLLMCLVRRPSVRWTEIPIRWGKAELSNVNPIAYGVRHLARVVSAPILIRLWRERREPSFEFDRSS